MTRTSGVRLGSTSQLWVDTEEWEVVALDVRPSGSLLAISAAVDHVLMSSLRQVGDVILVHDESAVERRWSSYGLSTVIGCDVVTERGTYIGRVRDYEFDPDDGLVQRIVVDALGLPIVPEGVVSTYALDVSEILSAGLDRIILVEGAESRVEQLSVSLLQRLQLAAPPWEDDLATYADYYAMDMQQQQQQQQQQEQQQQQQQQVEWEQQRWAGMPPQQQWGALPSPSFQQQQQQQPPQRQGNTQGGGTQWGGTQWANSQQQQGNTQEGGTQWADSQQQQRPPPVPPQQQSQQQGIPLMRRSEPFERKDADGGYGEQQMPPVEQQQPVPAAAAVDNMRSFEDWMVEVIPKLETLKPETRNQKPKTRNPKPETRNQKPRPHTQSIPAVNYKS